MPDDDAEAEEQTLAHLPPLTSESARGREAQAHNSSSAGNDDDDWEDEDEEDITHAFGSALNDDGDGDGDGDDGKLAADSKSRRKKKELRDELHPYVQALTPADLESCVALENATFSPALRCPREKIAYRLAKSGTFCLGLFTAARIESKLVRQASTAAVANSNESVDPGRKGVLLAHAIATKTANGTIHDEDMAVPGLLQPEQARQHDAGQLFCGHNEQGRTVALHSLAVLPEYQNRGLGRTLLSAYIQRLGSTDVVDRIALITWDDKVSFYENVGFDHCGVSKCRHGGQEWHDMVLDFDH